MKIQKAIEKDREDIALCIAKNFEKDFSPLSKDNKKIQTILKNGLNIDKFYTIKTDEEFVGTLSLSDINGRAMKTDLSTYIKNLGIIKGIITKITLKREFEKKLEYSKDTAYIELLAINPNFRRQKVASKLIDYVIKNTNYSKYLLEVTNINTPAINLYTSLGFKEIRRVKEKYAKYTGFDERIYMQYEK